MKKHSQATILTPEQIEETKQLPKTLTRAAGLLKGKKKIEALKYQRQVRGEWEHRFKDQAN